MSSAIYYGGTGQKIGMVSALRFSSFKELVDQSLNLAVALNITRDEYWEMPKDAQNAAKRVNFIVPASFTQPHSRRLHEHATHCNLVFLDIDELKDGTCPAVPYYNEPSTLCEQLAPFNFAVYATASSTPQKPRLRIVVEAKEIPLESYKKAVDYVARMIGLSYVTPESYVAVQPMYLPTLFKGEHEESHPLLVYNYNGRALKVEDLKNAHDNAFDRKEPVKDGSGSKVGANYLSGDALDFLRPTVPEASIEMVQEALEHLDPDMAYGEWLEIAAALRHQFYETENKELAYELFDTWSAKGQKYGGHKDTKAKWDSLRPNPVNRVPVTIRSLLQRAGEAGWASGKLKERCFQNLVRWIVDPDRSPTQLLSDGLGKIIATPLLSNSEEESLLHTISKRLIQGFAMKITISSLRKDMMELKAEMAEKQAAKKPKIIPPWAKGLCYVGAVDQFYRQSTRERFTPESLNTYYSRKLLPSDEELKSMPVPNATKPRIMPKEFLMNEVQIPAVYDYTYDPRFPNDTFLHEDGKPFVNLYIQNHPEPDKKAAAFAGKVFMRHMRLLVAEESYRTTIVDFMAHIVQHPGIKIRWALLLQGGEGCGKTFIAKALDAVLGRGHVRNVDVSALNSNYNEWAYGAQVVVLEEIRVVGHNRYDVMNTLKPLVSNDQISISQKFRDSRQVDNTVNYILFTNFHDAIVVSQGDRRYFVVKSPLQTKEQIQAIPDAYFEELFGMLKTHSGGLRHWLEDWPISDDFNPNGHAPRTTYLAQLLNDCASELVVAIREAIREEPAALISKDLVSSGTLVTHLQLHYSLKDNQLTGSALSAALRDEGFQKLGRYTVDGQRESLWGRVGTEMMVLNPVKEAEKRTAARRDIDPDAWSMMD